MLKINKAEEEGFRNIVGKKEMLMFVFRNIWLVWKMKILSIWTHLKFGHQLTIWLVCLQCAGGLSEGLGIQECAIKECQEEASLDDKTLEKLKSVGALRYFYPHSFKQDSYWNSIYLGQDTLES